MCEKMCEQETLRDGVFTSKQQTNNKTAAKRRMKSVRQTGTRQLMLFLQRYTVFKLLNYLVNELP